MISSNSSLTSQSVRVPAAYAFDPTNHVLIMEDVGALPSLKDFISSLPDSAGSVQNNEETRLVKSILNKFDEDSLCIFNQVGGLLGSYLARLHNWGLEVSSNGTDEDMLSVFRNNVIAKNVCAERTAGRLLAGQAVWNRMRRGGRNRSGDAKGDQGRRRDF